MTRENISQLACQCNAYRYINRAAKDEPTYTFSLDKLEAFYHAAQAEALEAAAVMLDTMESEWYDGYEFRKVLPDDCAAAIREMAKEMK